MPSLPTLPVDNGLFTAIVSTLSTQLVREFGKGFNRSALTRMVKFAEAFPDART